MTNATPLLLPGDILLTAADSWLGRAIRTATRDRGEAPSVVNHAALVVAGGRMPWATIVEARAEVRRHSIEAGYGDGGNRIAVARPLNVASDDLSRVIAEAERWVGTRYGYSQIGYHLLDWLIGRVTFRRRSPVLFRRLIASSRRRICSGLVGGSETVVQAYAAAALDFGVPGYAATPDDLWDFAISNPDKYAMIRDLDPYPSAAVLR